MSSAIAQAVTAVVQAIPSDAPLPPVVKCVNASGIPVQTAEPMANMYLSLASGTTTRTAVIIVASCVGGVSVLLLVILVLIIVLVRRTRARNYAEANTEAGMRLSRIEPFTTTPTRTSPAPGAHARKSTLSSPFRHFNLSPEESSHPHGPPSDSPPSSPAPLNPTRQSLPPPSYRSRQCSRTDMHPCRPLSSDSNVFPPPLLSHPESSSREVIDISCERSSAFNWQSRLLQPIHTNFTIAEPESMDIVQEPRSPRSLPTPAMHEEFADYGVVCAKLSRAAAV